MIASPADAIESTPTDWMLVESSAAQLTLVSPALKAALPKPITVPRKLVLGDLMKAATVDGGAIFLFTTIALIVPVTIAGGYLPLLRWLARPFLYVGRVIRRLVRALWIPLVLLLVLGSIAGICLAAGSVLNDIYRSDPMVIVIVLLVAILIRVSATSAAQQD